MAMTWDLNDVPVVATEDLSAAMRALVEDERGLVLMRGLGEDDMSVVQAELQRRFHGEPQRALAVFVRLRHMVNVFGARRLKDLLLERGYALLAPAIAVAASLRLNANRGFNPQTFLVSLNGALASNVVALSSRSEPHEHVAAQQLAA